MDDINLALCKAHIIAKKCEMSYDDCVCHILRNNGCMYWYIKPELFLQAYIGEKK